MKISYVRKILRDEIWIRGLGIVLALFVNPMSVTIGNFRRTGVSSPISDYHSGLDQLEENKYVHSSVSTTMQFERELKKMVIKKAL